MAFDDHQSTFASSLFPTYQRKAIVNAAGGNNSSMVLPFSIPSVSQQVQDAASYMPWSHNAHDEPHGLINCAQNSTTSRKLSENTDCEGETDLQGLVLNILDEADSQDSYFSKGGLPTCNPVWSPKTLREELLQYFQPEAKMQHNTALPLSYASREAFSKAQVQSVDKDAQDFCQQPNGRVSLPNGDRDGYTFRQQKLPPGLPVPNIGNTHLSQIQLSNCDHTSTAKDRGSTQTLNNFPDLSDVFRPQTETNNPIFHPYHDDHYVQSSGKLSSNEQYVPQDINELVSSFQSFMAGEQDNVPNVHRQTVGMHHEDSMGDQWKITSPAVSAQSFPAMQTPKQLVGDFGTVQMGRSGGVRNQTFKQGDFQDIPDFSPQNTQYFQQHKPFSGTYNLQSQYQNKMAMYKQNTSLPINMSMNHYPKHHIQQGQIQNKIKPQMQKEKRRMQMSGCMGEGFSARPISISNMRGGEKKQTLAPNSYFDSTGSMHSQRLFGENSVGGAWNTQQLMPMVYPVNDPQMHSNMSINPCNFNSRSTLPHGIGVPAVDMHDMMSANESAAFNSIVSDMMVWRGESTYHGMASPMTMMNDGAPVIQLYFYLDECYEQWRCLERERKKIEVILNKTFPGRRTAAVTNTNLPRTPPNPTRVDHLIVNQMREQARVSSLLDRMEFLCNMPLHNNIHTALNRHHMAICITQTRRKEEIASISKHQRQRAHFTEDRDTLLLVIALKDLAATTRKLRTTLWCALQMTLPKPVKRQDDHVNKEAVGAERSPSPFEGYSFRL